MRPFEPGHGLPQKSVYIGDLSSAHLTGISENIKQFVLDYLVLLIPNWDQYILSSVRVISRKKLKEFWERHLDVRQPLQAWYDDAKRSIWRSPADIKTVYRNDRFVFNLKGGSYRLVVAMRYEYGIVFMRFVGTHQEYDRIDAANV